MASIEMKCCHVKHKGEVWTLDLEDDGVSITDASGAQRTYLERAEAEKSVLLPSFSESIKQLRAPVDGQTWYFDVAKPDLKTIKAYLDAPVVAAGPEALTAIRTRGWRDVAIGIGAAVLGVGISVAGYLSAANNPNGGGGYTVTYGLVIVGLCMIARGIYNLLRYSKLKNGAAEAG